MPSNAVKFDRGSPTIVIVNESLDVTPERLKRVVKALQIQVDRDFFPLWGLRAKLRVGKTVPPGAMGITLINLNPDRDDAQGYHFVKGLPRAEVYTRGNDDQPYTPQEVSATLSHEVLEMIADPGVNLYARGFPIKGKANFNAFVGYEVCDAVQDVVYKVDGVEVSDFVAPEWFEPEHPPGSMHFSFRRSIKRPFARTPDGYIDVLVGKRIVEKAGRTTRKRRHRMEARQRRHAARVP